MNAHTDVGTAAPGALAKAALAWAHGARFLTTASQLHQLPANELPELAFVGRSNAGKSTAINTLAQQRRLAFASRTPGRTQHINLFEVGPKDAPNALFADLPGYGYAAVERAAKLRWQEVMADYLQLRRPLHGVVLMIDSRLGFTELDLRLLGLMAPRLANGEVRLLAVLTKADKLNRNDAQQALRKAQETLGEMATEAADISVALFSALSRQGLDDVAQTVHGWVTAVPRQVDRATGAQTAHGAEMPDATDATDATDTATPAASAAPAAAAAAAAAAGRAPTPTAP